MQKFYLAMRQCYRKSSFYAEKTAKQKAAQIVKQGGPQLYAYGCSQCGCYHLTKNAGAAGQVL